MPGKNNPLNRRGGVLAIVGASLLAFALVSTGQADVLDTTVQTEQEINRNDQTSQNRIDRLAEETDDLFAEYRRVVRETENLKVYNAQLQRVVNNQQEEIDIITAELEELESTNRGIVPLLIEMIDMFDKIVANDMPFLVKQRRNTVNNLKGIIDRSDVTTSEKYRRVMEAYQREIDYGRNVSHYEGELADTGKTVDFLKVGRTLLIYQTLDGEEVGWWNASSGAFEVLDDEYRFSVAQALRIAKNQEAPNLVKLPVPAAGGAK